MFKIIASKRSVYLLRNVYKDRFLAISWNDKAMTFLTTEWFDNTMARWPSACSLWSDYNIQHSAVSTTWLMRVSLISTQYCARYDVVTRETHSSGAVFSAVFLSLRHDVVHSARYDVVMRETRSSRAVLSAVFLSLQHPALCTVHDVML